VISCESDDTFKKHLLVHSCFFSSISVTVSELLLCSSIRSSFAKSRSVLLSIGRSVSEVQCLLHATRSVSGPILKNFSWCTISKVHV